MRSFDWPVLMRANQLRRRVVGRVRSIDMLQWATSSIIGAGERQGSEVGNLRDGSQVLPHQ